jgi:hypothetical protein
MTDGRELWREVRTHRDFGRATAAWLERRLDYHPSYVGARPDDESDDLIPALVAINERGFVTETSQPGVPLDENGSGQRAFLDGLCSESTAWRICRALHGTDLVVVAFPPLASGRGQIVVTLDEDEEHTWCGIHESLASAQSYGEISEHLVDLVLMSWTLQVIDPQWGRNDLLWPAVLGALDGNADDAS